MGFLDFSGLARFKEHLDTLFSNKLSTSLKGAANGVAELDASGKVPSSQLPSYVDDVLEFSTYSDFPVEGETGKIYVDLETNISYRWSGSTYVKIASDLALGETSSTAYRGDRGASAYTHAVTNKGSAFANGLYKITTNEEGHVTAATAVQTSDITSLGIAAKDATAVEGNFAAFDSNGNPVDSGHKHSDYITAHQDISGKLDKTYETLSSFSSVETLNDILTGVITNMPANSKTLVKAECSTGFSIFTTQTSYFFEIAKGSSNSSASILIGLVGGHWLYSCRKSGDNLDFKMFKTTQSAVSDPSADGTGITFIDSISQDTNGIITPHKKTVQTMGAASSSDSGSEGLVPAPTSGKQSSFLRGDATWAVPTNTKNTAGATDSSSKLFLIGATSQADNPQTYSHDTAYVGTDGCLYSGGVKVLTSHQDISGKLDKTYETLSSFASESDLKTILSAKITEMSVSSRKLVRAQCTTAFSVFGANNSYFFEISKGGSDTYASIAIAPIGGSWKYCYNKNGDTWTLTEFKVTQTAVSDPSADGTGVTFIDTISQNAQGVISPHKKTVRTFGAASASANGTTGLVPAPGSGKQSLFLRGDATWATPTNTTYADFTGATSSAAGAHGLVPAPASGKQNSFLRGDKTWAVPANTTYATMGAASASVNGSSGLVPAPGSGKQGMFLRGDATWATPTNTTYADFTAATSAAAGAHGLVPAPGSGKQNSFLRGDKTWAIPTNTTYGNATESAAGLVSTGTQSFAGNKTFTGYVLSEAGTSQLDITEADNGLTSDLNTVNYRVVDKDGDYASAYGLYSTTDGIVGAEIRARNVKADGTTNVYNVLRVMVNKTGSATYSVSSPANFRSAIGIANMTGATSAANGTAGYVPAPGSGKQGMFLRGDATWATPTNTTYADFTAATSSTAGVHGLVPAPGSGKQGSFLRGDKTWAAVKVPQTAVSDPSADGTSATFIATISQNTQGVISATKKTVRTMGAATASANGSTGLVPAPGSGKQGLFLRGDATWQTPTNTTYADFTGATSAANGAHGLVPAPGSGKQTSFLRGDKTWAVPTNTTYADFTAATSSAAGAHGLVPAPGSGKQSSFLRGDKTWAIPTNTTYANASADNAGLVSTGTQTLAGDKTFTGLIKNTNGTIDLDITKSNNGISSDIGPLNYRVIDKNGYYVTALSAYAKSDGTIGAQLSARNKKSDGTTDAYNVFRVMIDKSGASTYSVSSPANFRSAIGVDTMDGATASAGGSSGLVPTPSSGKQGMFLRGDATWATPTNTTYADFTGASASAAGAHGLVPAPGSGKQGSFLMGNGTWATPTNTTYADFTAATASAAGTHGLVPAPGSGKQASFLRGDKTWAVPTNTTYADFTAATASAAGTHGLVPAPGSGKQASFLRGDKTWAVPTNTTYAVMGAASASANGTSGLVPAPGSGKQASFLRGDKTWAVPTNTTYADFTGATSAAAGAHGLVPAPGSGKQASFLRGDKTWAVPTNTTYADFTGATSAAAGAHGLVPAPGSGKQGSFLKGNKSWSAVTWSDVTSKPTTFAPSSHDHASLTQRTSLTKGTKPSSVTYYGANTVYETGSGTASGNRLTWIGGYVDTSGRNVYEIGAYRFASGSTASNYFAVGVNFDGTAYYSVSNAEKFRDAISVPSTTGGGASGTWAISISGNAAYANNGVSRTSGIADVYTADSTSGGGARLRTPSYQLILQSIDGNVVMRTSDGLTNYWYITSAGVLTKGSSYKIKDNIKSITNEEISNFMRLNPVSFTYKPELKISDKNLQYGLIAEEVAEIYPNIVSTPEELKVNNDTGQSTPGIKYDQFIPLLIKMVQNQQLEIDALKEQLSRRK